MAKPKANSDQEQSSTPTEKTVDIVVENSNDNILSSIDNYLLYIRQNIRDILNFDGLMYSEPMDIKKIYPAFTYKQFIYILNRLYDRVYSQNLELLQEPPYIKPLLNDIYNNSKIRYNIPKVELAYKVYFRLCSFYGFVCCWEPFLSLTGIAQETLESWLSSGRSAILKVARENNKNSVITDFENSAAPLLRMASANYKHGLTTPLQEREAQAAVEVLPDLLTIAQDKKALPGGEN